MFTTQALSAQHQRDTELLNKRDALLLTKSDARDDDDLDDDRRTDEERRADSDLDKTFRESRRYRDWPAGSNGPKSDEDPDVHPGDSEQDLDDALDAEHEGDGRAAKSKRILPGDADSPGRDIPVRSSHLPHTLRGHVSHQLVGGVSFDHVNCQGLKPAVLTTLRTAGHDGSGSSIHDNQGSATVARLDNRAAAANGPILGSPSGRPGQPALAPAPSGHASRFGTTPKRPGGLPYLPGPGT